MKNTKNPYPDRNALIEESVSSYSTILKKQEGRISYEDMQKKKRLLEEFFFLDKQLSSVLHKAENNFTIFNNQESRKIVFRLLFWNHKNREFGKLKRFLFVPIFDVNDKKNKKGFFNKRPVLVLCWDICTTKISFMFLFDVSDSKGSGFKLSKNLTTSEEAAFIRVQGVSREEINEKQECCASFVEKLISSGILSDEKKIENILTQNFSGAFLDEKIVNLNVYVRSREIIELGKKNTPFSHLSPMIFGDDPVSKKNLEEAVEALNDEGCSDFQEVLAFNNGKLREMRVGCVRKHFTELPEHRFYFSEEPSSYRSFVWVE